MLLWPLWCESVCTLTRRLTLKIGKAFPTSLHSWFCIWIPITMITSIITSLFMHRRNENQRGKQVWHLSTVYLGTAIWKRDIMLGTKEELGSGALVKCVFICSRRQNYVPLCLMSHFIKNHTRLGHPVSRLCHRPILLSYSKNEQNSQVSNRAIFALLKRSLGYQCFETH